MPDYLRPYSLIFGAGLIWGSTFSLTLIATAHGMDPLILASFQAVICAVLFVLICRFFKVPVFRRKCLKYYVVLAILGITAPNLLYYSAAPHLSAGILSITVSTVPMLTYALAWVLRLERTEIRRMLGIGLGMLAILLLVLPDQGLASSDASFWTLMVLVCAACYAVENLYISEGIAPEIDVRELLSGSNIVASIFLVPMSLTFGPPVSPDWFVSGSALAVFGIAISSILAYMMFFQSIKTAGPVFASQCAYIVTISGVVWGIILLGESHTFWVWLSVGVMVLGLALVSPRESASQVQSRDPASELPG